VKADRLPLAAYRRLTEEQRRAVDELRWRSPAPAARARLKLLLGWKRTGVEATALARELEVDGLNRKAIAAYLGVSDRHLRRLLADPDDPAPETPEIGPANPVVERAQADTTCDAKVIPYPGRRTRPAAGFVSFADLDRWLDEEPM
jgi:hypothetical protein